MLVTVPRFPDVRAGLAIVLVLAGLSFICAATFMPGSAAAKVVASRTVTLPATGDVIRVQAVRTLEPNFAVHWLRLQRLIGGRFRTVDKVQVSTATPQKGGRDFCGLRIVSRLARSVRVSQCVWVTASVGRVPARFTATRSRLTRE